MSWKATAYVKDLRKRGVFGLREKFVLLILADYHNTDTNAAWPSLNTLADKCFMSKRGLQLVLSRLIESGHIKKVPGCGRGNVSGYEIVGVDETKKVHGVPPFCGDEKMQISDEKVQISHEKVQIQARKGADLDTAIRKEPLEPKEQNELSRSSSSTTECQSLASPEEEKQEAKRVVVESASESTHREEKPPAQPALLALNGNGNGLDNSPPAVIERAFAYYCKELDKNPKRYTLLPKRKKQGISRFTALIKQCKDAGYSDCVGEAKKLMWKAIAAMAKSDFHRTNGYDDWEQIFRSDENMQKWIDRWYNPPEPQQPAYRESRL